MFDNATTAVPQVKAGRLRALAVTSAQRIPALADVPTMVESGFPDFVLATWNGVWTTGGTPPAVVARLETELRKVIAMPEVVASINKTGVKVTNLGSRELAKIIQDEAAHWAGVLKYAGVKPQ